jgi:molybdopterin synthase sulfur carrier subunit
MEVILHTILGLKQAIGQRQMQIELPDESTVGGLLSYMMRRWGDKLSPHLLDPSSGKLLSHVRVMVNGQTIRFLQGMETPLQDGDEVLFLPLVSGGQRERLR